MVNNIFFYFIDKITDLCTNVTSPINASWGIIRSHSVYPWYFDTRFAECKRILIVSVSNVKTEWKRKPCVASNFNQCYVPMEI